LTKLYKYCNVSRKLLVVSQKNITMNKNKTASNSGQTPFIISLQEEIYADKKSIEKRLIAVPGLFIFITILLGGFLFSLINKENLTISLSLLGLYLVGLIILLCFSSKFFSREKILKIYLNSLEKEEEERKRRSKSQKRALANFKNDSKESPGKEAWIKFAQKVNEEEIEALQICRQKKTIVLSEIKELMKEQ